MGAGFATTALADVAFPLKVSADGRRTVDQNNVPFLINGDSPWMLMVALTKAETTFYLDDRKSRGFNTILLELIENTYVGPTNREGEAPFSVYGDFSTVNEAYFEHADWVINEALQRDMVVFVAPIFLGYGCGADGWCQELAAAGPAEAREYGRWIGARYRDFPNIVWAMAGDTDTTLAGADEAHEAFIAGLKETDDQHLITAHCSRYNSSLDCYDEPWLTLNGTYTDCSTAAAGSKTSYERIGRAPFLFFEGGYEGDGTPSWCARAQAYWSILAGSNGHIYGNYPVWEFSSGWQSALGAPGGASLTHLYSLFTSRPWHLLQPDFDHNVLVAGYGALGFDYAASALTTDRQTFIAYTPSQKTLTVDLSQIEGSDVRAWWFDPVSGIATLISDFPANGTQDFTPPASGDWLLVIDNAALDLPPPGQEAFVVVAPNPPENLAIQ